MSTTGTKRPRDAALADARDLCRLAGRACWARWEVAGSVRRKRSLVGDVEHVVVPAFGEVEVGGGLFAERRTANLLWHRLDELLAAGAVGKWWNGRSHAWGERCRRVEFRGHCHDFYLADAANLGSVLAIRTGPADFSRRLVVGLRANGLRNLGGYVRRAVDGDAVACGRCDWRGPADDLSGDRYGEGGACPACGSARLGGVEGEVVPAPDERTYFALAGVPWAEPEDRQ